MALRRYANNKDAELVSKRDRSLGVARLHFVHSADHDTPLNCDVKILPIKVVSLQTDQLASAKSQTHRHNTHYAERFLDKLQHLVGLFHSKCYGFPHPLGRLPFPHGTETGLGLIWASINSHFIAHLKRICIMARTCPLLFGRQVQLFEIHSSTGSDFNLRDEVCGPPRALCRGKLFQERCSFAVEYRLGSFSRHVSVCQTAKGYVEARIILVNR